MMNISYSILIYLSLYFVQLISIHGNKTVNELAIDIHFRDNNTFMLYYNLTTNYSYYLTFRLFGHEQMKFGLFQPTYQYEQYYMEVSNKYNVSNELFYLFIICFYFIRQFNDIDIQCKDIRVLKINQIKSADEFLPTYKPLFIPMMYALSILMLLPVIIQHSRQKQAKIIERRKQIRRLSVSIAHDNPNILSHIIDNRNLNLKKLHIQIELGSLPSTNLDDNDNVTYTLQALQPFFDKYDDGEESGVTADDCIAHLLNSAPWNSPSIEEPSLSSPMTRDVTEVVKKVTFYDNDDDDRQPVLKLNAHCTVNLLKVNPTFIESDV